jgi:hypothetical protein
VLVTIELDSGEVTATAYHPFWVIQGLDLDNRPPVSHLLPNEDRGQSLPGRWVNSHELMERDIVFIRDGGPTSIRRVAHRQVNISVCNLTIRGLHTFCVGTTQVLVHNESGTVGPINPGGAAPKTAAQAVAEDANSQGLGGLRNAGNPGTSPNIRELPGTGPEARSFFDALTQGGKVKTDTPAITIVEMPDGTFMTFRPAGKVPNNVTGVAPPTIDVNIPGQPRLKLKMLP